jgi:GT2 family glycosyltransferase
MTHLFLATPCYGGLLTHGYLHSVLTLVRQAAAGGPKVTVETLAGDSLIPRARNTLVAKFLAEPSATHLLFVDADISFTPAHVARLLALGEDVAACVYPLKHLDWDDAAVARARAGELISTAPLRYVGKPADPPERRGAFLAADYAGTGLMLISRRAIQRLTQAHPELRYTAAHATLDTPSDLLFALFDTAIDPVTRHYLSEDYAFCARWRALGGKIWIDTEAILTHSGTHDFTGNPASRFLA